jgi:hypothetical protein
LPPAFGMNTRLTGQALNGSVGCCTLETSFNLASELSATSPSTPAVRRPAFCSVTRRTLKSVFERDRSINLCNRRTLARSPAFDAVKIRCRNRRTSCSAERQSIWRQPKTGSSSPLTTTEAVVASSLSIGSGGRVIFFLTGSPDHVSPPSRPGTMPGIRPVIRDPQPEGTEPTDRGFLSPFGHRRSLLGHPIPAQGLSVPHGQPTGHAPEGAQPDLDGVTAFRTHEQRPARAPPLARGQRCPSRTGRHARPAFAASQRRCPCTPATNTPSTRTP